MKVSTDSLILGSWVDVGAHKSMLDIGTGSGILALMLMQRAGADASLDAIDINADAVREATENVQASPWSTRITVRQANVTQWQPAQKYALIVTNPPYFPAPNGPTRAYQQQTKSRADARHTAQLGITELIEFASTHLRSSGELYCVYPYSMREAVAAMATVKGLKISKRLDIRHQPDRDCYLSAFCLSARNQPVAITTLTIRDDEGKYTQGYKTLCQPYYLNF